MVSRCRFGCFFGVVCCRGVFAADCVVCCGYLWVGRSGLLFCVGFGGVSVGLAVLRWTWCMWTGCRVSGVCVVDVGVWCGIWFLVGWYNTPLRFVWWLGLVCWFGWFGCVLGVVLD